MKKLTLNNLIYTNYLKTSLASILFIELTLLILYFNVSSYIIKENMHRSLNEVRNNISLNITSETKNIDSQLQQISLMNKFLQKEQQYFFEQNEITYTFKNPPQFITADNGVFYKKNNNGGSSVYVSSATPLTKEIKDKLYRTESFDKSFKTIIDNNKNVVAVYSNFHDNISRYYPFLDKVYEIFSPTLELNKYNFYYEADLKHNPQKTPVWTDVYLDPAGQGWMISNIVPIYNHGYLEAVTGIDVRLDAFIENILTMKIPYEGQSFMINKKGVILAMTKDIEEILNIKELKSHKYNDVINETIFKPDEFNIFKPQNNKSFESLKKSIMNDKYDSTIVLNSKRYLFFNDMIKETNWKIISLLEEDKVLSSVYKLQVQYKIIGYYAIVFMFIFYILFFIFLNKKSKELVEQIVIPISQIIDKTKNLGKNLNQTQLEDNKIYEISLLNQNFNEMSNELENRTKRLIEIESEKKISEHMANTDILTGLYNRRYLEFFSEKLIAMAKRENFDISVILFDIDEFKNINDTYGHHLGDEVIKKISKLVIQTVRNNDIIVRLGGDEFIIVLPHATIQNAINIAKNIQDKLVNDSIQTENGLITFTLSFGISQYNKSEISINDTIIRADNALYMAKNSGRNNIKSVTL